MPVYRRGTGQLTRRERQVLDLISRGKQAPDIALIVERDIDTIEAHRYNLSRKLDTTNSAQSVRMGFELGYLRLEERYE